MPDLTVIIPTYNENKTIINTIQEINRVLKPTGIDFDILVVDDDSSDGTQIAVRGMIKLHYPVELHVRTSHPGLSESVVEGFALAQGSVIVVTDADLSHDITKIPEMYREIMAGNDIVIGSRYMEGGGIADWPRNRRIISFGATFLARLLFPDLTDPISGFFAIKRELVNKTVLKPRGYKILLEILGRTEWTTCKEIPYEFTNRKDGESKLRTRTIIEYAKQVVDIARYPGRCREEVMRAVKFGLVGGSGIFVNMIMLVILKAYFGLPLLGAIVIAIELAIFTNFLLNDYWTFGKILTDKSWLRRFLSFNGISIGGMVINIVVLMVLTYFGIYYLIANLIGIILGFVWNFLANRRTTWIQTK